MTAHDIFSYTFSIPILILFLFLFYSFSMLFTFQKAWSTSQKEITYQPERTEVVHMTVTFFLKELIGKSVLIRSDNSTVV